MIEDRSYNIGAGAAFYASGIMATMFGIIYPFAFLLGFVYLILSYFYLIPNMGEHSHKPQEEGE